MEGKFGRIIVGFLVIMLPLSFIATAHAQEKVITWKLAGFYTPGSEVGVMPEAFAKQVTEKSGGRLKIITYPAGQLYGIPEMFGALQKNLVQVADFNTGWWSNEIPVYRLPDMPFFLKDNKEWKAWLDAGFREILDREAEKVGFKINVCYGQDAMQGFSIYPIRTSEDAKGHKWRVHTPQLAAAVKEIGATPVNIAFNETYQALQRGMIDTAFGGVPFAYMFKWHEVAKYITKVGLGVPSSIEVLNKKAFDELPPDLKDIVVNVGKDVEKLGWSYIAEVLDKKWKAFEEAGCTIIDLPDKERDKWLAKVKHIWTEEAQKVGPLGMQALESYYKAFPNRRP